MSSARVWCTISRFGCRRASARGTALVERLRALASAEHEHPQRSARGELVGGRLETPDRAARRCGAHHRTPEMPLNWLEQPCRRGSPAARSGRFARPITLFGSSSASGTTRERRRERDWAPPHSRRSRARPSRRQLAEQLARFADGSPAARSPPCTAPRERRRRASARRSSSSRRVAADGTTRVSDPACRSRRTRARRPASSSRSATATASSGKTWPPVPPPARAAIGTPALKCARVPTQGFGGEPRFGHEQRAGLGTAASRLADLARFSAADSAARDTLSRIPSADADTSSEEPP